MINPQEIYKWWDVFKNGCDLTEIRILDGQRTYSGYFKDINTLIAAIKPYENLPHAQIYFTLNHIKDACYSRVQRDKMILVKREPTTGDLDIDGRTHVLIDLDPIRPAGVGSSDQELHYAYLKAIDLYNYLLSQGFNEPIVGRSGNGYHITLPCRIGAEPEKTEVIKNFIKVCSLMFSDEHVEVDEKVFNLSRICKLPGTCAMKGEYTSERPWRMAQIVRVPQIVKPTEFAYFKKIAELYPKEEIPNRYNNYSTERFDLVSFLQKHGIGYKEERVAGGTKYILDHCPFNDQHKHKDAVIFQRDSGAIGFLCFHNSCSGKTWKDVRLLYEPDAYSHIEQPVPQMYKQSFRQPVQQSQPLVQQDEKGHIWLKMSDIKKPKIDLADFIPSGIPVIDKRGLGFRRGDVTIWTGFRGCGKSSLLSNLILNSSDKGYKNAIYTGELKDDQFKQWLYLQAAGKQYTRKYGQTDFYYIPDNIAARIDKWIDKYVWLFNNKYGDNFMQISEQLKRLKESEDLDVAYFDNLMVLNYRELDQDKFERQGILLQRCEDLAKELNIHIHIVAHPNKASGFIRVDNISGSGDISNRADNVMLMHRVNQDFKINAKGALASYVYTDIISSGCTNVVEIGKFRTKGSLVGEFAKLYFELESNRLKNSLTESITYGWNDDAVQAEMPFDAPDDSVVPF